MGHYIGGTGYGGSNGIHNSYNDLRGRLVGETCSGAFRYISLHLYGDIIAGRRGYKGSGIGRSAALKVAYRGIGHLNIPQLKTCNLAIKCNVYRKGLQVIHTLWGIKGGLGRDSAIRYGSEAMPSIIFVILYPACGHYQVYLITVWILKGTFAEYWWVVTLYRHQGKVRVVTKGPWHYHFHTARYGHLGQIGEPKRVDPNKKHHKVVQAMLHRWGDGHHTSRTGIVHQPNRFYGVYY